MNKRQRHALRDRTSGFSMDDMEFPHGTWVRSR